MRKYWRSAGATLGLLAAFVSLNNTSLFNPRPPAAPVLLAHRGIAQQFDPTGVGNDTCTASRMLPPAHDYLENTIASMRAGFAAGADIVEADIHPTTDGQFAVFHDWTLDCRTQGKGVTRDHSMAELKALDIGYGYTADGGKTFPLRGKGIGLMPSLDEVLSSFPDKQFLINIKSNDPEEGKKLAAVLSALPADRRQTLMVYGGDRPVAALRAALADIRAMSRSSLKTCLLRYFATGWTGIVPDACRNSIVLVPINIAPWLWGWPDRFLDRMEGAGSRVFALGPYSGGDFSTGLDTPELISRLPQNYSGGIWTNEVETVASELRRGGR
ncbi:glycerophosphodiester phosphodiesterase family protein [Rhizobium sp. LjRoot98]|uniref:glycerophosphodiester phosphodiesterase family protein n=1 Tax=unclassified Rhizobium TaxID=2613769 RepID=UPI000713CDF1|nr:MULTISPECIES: glycerophosphodiester phosphodiesterase family protein [unclassified Rhizobium]KQV29247.1 glycerophosphodiester phosphodiesterase [Rhizobium sp. Root1204]KQY03489.1 glycerophosphodiester phosphodiesterase [Rhizobium sp. Root1334]KRC00139.1 glycerophosphodiester phosphodiesterase [Rhizobium sp. Root73]